MAAQVKGRVAVAFESSSKSSRSRSESRSKMGALYPAKLNSKQKVQNYHNDK